MITIYSTTEVAKEIGTSDRSVRRRIKNGQLKAVTVQSKGRVTYGVTDRDLKNYKSATTR
jgi:hypothetical protein